METRDLVIIGGGPGGLAAAIYGRRSGLSTVVLEKGNLGGAITRTDEIENYPGISHSSGLELGKMFHQHAQGLGAEFLDCTVQGLELEGVMKRVATTRGDFLAKAVVIATGSEFRKLGCPGEEEFTGKGVCYCATCDGAFFQGCEVAVVGGGNTAVEEGCYLTQFASKVYVIHRRDQFRADEIAVERMKNNPKVVPVYSTVVESIQGSVFVEKLVLKNVKTGEISELPVEGVFMFVGNVPNNQLVKDLVETAPGGWIKVNANMETSVPGIFAVGDVRETPLRQVITAAADGAVAGQAAYKYIAENFQ